MQSVRAVRREVCAPSLMRLAARLAGEPADADDLVQSTLLRALEHEVPTDRGPWLRRVLTNERNMWLRARTRRQARETIHADGPEPVDVEDVVHALELAEIVRELVDELDPSTREVVEARYFDGRTAAEVARELGIPAGTVRWRLKQGLDTLRGRLDRRYGGRRALWAGAALNLQKPPTLAASTASKGAMTLKVLATVAALFTVGTAGAVVLSHEAPEHTAVSTPSDSVKSAPPQPEVAPLARADFATPSPKDAWTQRRSGIRKVLQANPSPSSTAEPEAAEGTLDAADLSSEVTSIVGGCMEFLQEATGEVHLTAHVIGAPGEGTIVEEVSLGDGSDANADLSECLTESMYTLDLGDPDEAFEQDVELHLKGGAGAHADDEALPEHVREAFEKAAAEGRHGSGVVMVGPDGEVSESSMDDLPAELREKVEAAVGEADLGHVLLKVEE